MQMSKISLKSRLWAIFKSYILYKYANWIDFFFLFRHCFWSNGFCVATFMFYVFSLSLHLLCKKFQCGNFDSKYAHLSVGWCTIIDIQVAVNSSFFCDQRTICAWCVLRHVLRLVLFNMFTEQVNTMTATKKNTDDMQRVVRFARHK